MEQTATGITQPKQGQGKLNVYKTGNTPGARKVTGHSLDILLELKLNDCDLADELIKLVKQGDLGAIKYAYDRVAGLPVQRLEAKLLSAVMDDAHRIAEEQGIDYVDVMARATKLAQGT